MDMFHRKIISLFCTGCIVVSPMVFASAADRLGPHDTVRSVYIPRALRPGTTIEYVGRAKWEVVQTKEEVEEAPEIDESPVEEELEKAPLQNAVSSLSREEEDKLVEQIHKEVENITPYREMEPIPVVGMRVTYDNWGNPEGFCLPDENGDYLKFSRDMEKERFIQSTDIPETFDPDTIIEYVDRGVWRLVGEAIKEDYFIPDDETPLEEASLQNVVSSLSREEEDRLVEQIHKEVENLPIQQITLPEPTVGMRVAYDHWGNAGEISIPDTDGMYLPLASALEKGTRAEPGTYTYGEVESNNVGYTENKITISGTKKGHVLGEGDFSVFTDKKGDHGNTLKRGDCATKGSIDNPKSGTRIQTRNMTNDRTFTFTKNDNGTLNNAVLDIWKTGVEDLGITETNYNNIKFAGRYYYEF